MSSSLFSRKALACWCLALAVPAVVLGQGNYAPNGAQYGIAGVLPGEQVHPQLSLSPAGGFLVWEDNVTDGYGLGVSALRLDATLSATFSPFRVNEIGIDDQERPVVSMLRNGGAAFAWLSGKQGFQHVYARFRSPGNTWVTGDVLVNSGTNFGQLNPVITTLANSNVVVVYGSMNQASPNSLQDVYAQILTQTGEKIGGELMVNQFTAFNQRAPSVAALADGRFVVVWVSEQQRSGNVDVANADYDYSPTNFASVDIFARVFSPSGAATGPEILVNTAYEICSTPVIAAGTDGGFMISWAQKTYAVPAYGMDIVARSYSASLTPGNAFTVNSYLYGDQFSPQIAALGTDYFISWTSLAQDGSREGVYAQILRGSGAKVGSEIRANTTTVAAQMHPCVASDGNTSFLVAWTSFTGGEGSFDLFAQRYLNAAQALQPMEAPYVNAPFVLAPVGTNDVYQPELQVAWAFLDGIAIDHYEVYVDGSPVPRASVTTNLWLMTAADGLTPNSTHTFQVAYVAADGRRSPLSAPVSGTTWGGYSWGDVPFEWMSRYYGGNNVWTWPSPTAQVSPGGPTVEQVFLTGANPLDPATWLRTAVVQTPQGHYLTWNPQPGLIYQVQTSPNLSSWANLGTPRFASGASDSIFIGGNNMAYYRVLRLR